MLGHGSGVCVRVGGVGQDRRAMEQAKMRQGVMHCAGVWTSGGGGRVAVRELVGRIIGETEGRNLRRGVDKDRDGVIAHH